LAGKTIHRDRTRMALYSELLRPTPAAPNLWATYALATLNRLAYYGNDGWFNQWGQWAGATRQRFFPASDVIFSSAVIMADDTKAIVAWEGTRNVTQFTAQVLGSAQIAGTVPTGDVSAFQALNMARRNIDVLNTLRALPGINNVTLVGHSLGGAIAQMTCALQELNLDPAPLGLVTFGQPRTGNAAFCNSLITPYLRVATQNDPVSLIPPTYSLVNGIVSTAFLGYAGWEYVHTQAALRLPVQGYQVLNPDPPTGQAEWQVALSLADGSALSNTLLSNHLLSTYCLRLRTLLDAVADRPNVDQLDALNIAMDQADGLSSGIPLPPINPPNPGLLADPNVTIQGIPPAPVVPLRDRGNVVQQIGLQVEQFLPIPADRLLSTPIGGPMAAIAKVTFFFTCNGYGWTESYWSQAAFSLPQQYYPQAFNLAGLRAQLMGNNTTLTHIRISLINVPATYGPGGQSPPRNSQLFTLAPPLTGPGVQPGDPTKNPTDMPDVCMLCRWIPTIAVASKLQYMRGIPDDFDVMGGLPALTPVAYFGGSWTNFVTAIQTGFGAGVNQTGPWGYVGKNPGAQAVASISALTQTSGGYVSITTSTNLFNLALTPVNSVVPVRISKLTVPGNLNSVHPVQVYSANQFVTEKKIAILAWDSSPGKVTYSPLTYIPVATVQFSRIGERKAGRPFAVARGRAPIRKTA
jgi:pimeloyl-ACP methyl ester carboxylesterase